MTTEPGTRPEWFAEPLPRKRDRVPPSLMKPGHMEQAKKLYLTELWWHGDEELAAKRIGRSRKTIYWYKGEFPEFDIEVNQALEFHRRIARGELVALLPKAMARFKENLEQTDDRRMANQNAIIVLKDQKVLGVESAAREEARPPGVTKIVILNQPTFNSEKPAIPIEVSDDD